MQIHKTWVSACMLYWMVGHFSDSANILGISYFPAISHQRFFQPIWRGLIEKGHNLTVITAIPMTGPSLKNFTEIRIDALHAPVSNVVEEIIDIRDVFRLLLLMRELFITFMDIILNDTRVQQLLNSSTHFDVIIAECHCPVLYAFGYWFKAPVIGKMSQFTIFI